MNHRSLPKIKTHNAKYLLVTIKSDMHSIASTDYNEAYSVYLLIRDAK